MTTSLRNNIVDVPEFFTDLASDNLPAVSFIRPYEGYAGHPANSTLSAYENFIANVANSVILNPKAFKIRRFCSPLTRVAVTTTRATFNRSTSSATARAFPLMVISAYAKEGFIDHTYYDHGSILKFIEANWGLSPLSSRSRDNLPNPTATSVNPYVPTNAPAIGDLIGLFDFSHLRDKNQTPLIIPGASVSRVAPAPAGGRYCRSDTKKRRRSHHAASPSVKSRG